MSQNRELDELRDIKKLVIYLLLRDGARSEEIGRVIGVDSSTIRHMVSLGETKKSKAV